MQSNGNKVPTFKHTEEEPVSDLENGTEGSSQILLAGEASVVLDRKSRIMGSNEAARRLFGQELNPGESLHLEDIIQGPYLTEAQSALDNALGKGEGTQNLSAIAEDAQGNSFNCLYSANPIFGPGKQVIGVLLCVLDADYGAIQPRPFTDPSLLPQMPTLGFESLLEQLAEGIFTINSRWRIISFNQTAERITGYQRAEVLGRFCWEIFRSDLCQSDCPLRLTLETGLTRLDQDVRMLDKKGTKLPVLVNTSVLRDRSGLVIGAVESFRPLMEMQENIEPSPGKPFPSDIIGKSAPMTRIFQMLPDLSATDVNVLIQGESGTGKELIARAIHNQSPYKEGPFIAVNCSALAESLLESELFGHEKAAFTGAVRSKVGRFELARGGTLFLDEIGELKPELQVKLLRVLEQKVFERVGGTRLIPMQARIISATNRDLAKALREGTFREDLFYRLRTVPITIPPLRERREDIPLLIDHFLARLNKKYHKEVRGLDPKVLRLFMTHHWPGNVRELERVLEHAFVFVKGPVIFLNNLPAMDEFFQERKVETLSDREIELDRQTIQKALNRTGGRREEAAALLGLSRTSLWRKMKQFEIN
ncbi:MAG: sigma 54-interacting transcriptional regulator [Deltaproteobacteria bacterium]|nr:sigma 54-interacting transcriptional regulator [Deltaproteobacteria bacterium]